VAAFVKTWDHLLAIFWTALLTEMQKSGFSSSAKTKL
jgi:hypothetical protein